VVLLAAVSIGVLGGCFEAPVQCMTDPCGAAPDAGDGPVTVHDAGAGDGGATDGGQDAGDPFDAGTVPLTCGHSCTAPWSLGERAMHPSAPGLRDVVVARLDGDCVDDVAAVRADGKVLIYRGTGNALLDPLGTYPLVGEPLTLVAEDFDQDGDLDLAVTHDMVVSLLLNSGQGQFEAGLTFPVGGPEPRTLVAADVNGDGLVDLLVGVGKPSRLYRLRNLGGGSFDPPWPMMMFEAEQQAPHLATLDFDGDGILDLAVSREVALMLMRGKGDGTFHSPAFRPVNGKVAAGDLNRDGLPDLVVGGWTLMNKGMGNLVITATVTNGDDFVLADFDGDGVLDVGSTVGIALGNGDGTFKPVTGYGMLPHRWAVAAGNLDGDNRADLVVAHLLGNSGESLSTLLSSCR
jgi:hypothetical protein